MYPDTLLYIYINLYIFIIFLYYIHKKLISFLLIYKILYITQTLSIKTYLYTYTIMSTINKMFEYLVKYNKETSQLIDLLLFNIISILFRIFITLLQLFIIFVFAVSAIFIPLMIITHIYIIFSFTDNAYILH